MPLCFKGSAALLLPILLWACPVHAQTTGGATATGISRAFNPAISANGLFRGGYASRTTPGFSTGIAVQEIETVFSAFVDPYLKADLVFTLPEGEGIEVEEGYVTFLDLPADLTVRVGKFWAGFGKHNTLHTHQFPFIDNNLVSEQIFGGERLVEGGLNEVGGAVSHLLPLPWYSEVVMEVLNGDNKAIFGSPNPDDLAYLGHWKNFWDLSESATLEVGESYTGGRNHFGRWSHVVGADLTLKWRPPRRAIYRSLTWQTEYLYARRGISAEATDATGGFYSLVQYQFARRWWVQGRYEVFGLPEPDREEKREGSSEALVRGQYPVSSGVAAGRAHRASALLALVLSEFSALRLQYNLLRERGETTHQGLFQINFTIGSHPAHKY